LIRHKVGRLLGGGVFGLGDRDDLEQELALHWVLREGRYDPERASLATYASRTLDSRVIDLLRRARAAKRDRRREWRVDDVPEDLLAVGPADQERVDLGLDVAEALAGLAGVARDVAMILTSLSEAEAVRATGMSRQRVRTAKHEIERHLRARGVS
jgi:RNA polymerase sigma factor (sigma-70 family)